ncbi:MAG: hypothetical protein Q7S11_02620 [bacterium]|nr:hypothetical protein [bacterium]
MENDRKNRKTCGRCRGTGKKNNSICRTCGSFGELTAAGRMLPKEIRDELLSTDDDGNEIPEVSIVRSFGGHPAEQNLQVSMYMISEGDPEFPLDPIYELSEDG